MNKTLESALGNNMSTDQHFDRQMPQKCCVSIVVINHNYGRFLPYAVESALGQTYGNTEVIVVDDGSTDSSREIIATYGARITTILKPAGGHVSAVNDGFAASRGELVIFLDADDVLYPQCVEIIVKSWQPGDAKLQYRLDTIDKIGVNQNMIFPYFPPDLTPEAIKTQSRAFGVYPWTVSSGNAFSRGLLQALLPIDATEIYRSPDGFLSKMAPLFGDVKSLPEILGAYRVHGANAWAQDKAGFRVEPIIRWLKFDQVLQSRFEATANARGIPIRKAGNTRNTQHIEHRLLALRFGPAQTPYKQDKIHRVCLSGIKAAFVAPNMSMPGRLLWSTWFVFLSVAPSQILQKVLTQTRLQTGRTNASKLLVSLSRGSARS